MTRAFGELKEIPNRPKLITMGAVRRTKGFPGLIRISTPIDLFVRGGVADGKIGLDTSK